MSDEARPTVGLFLRHADHMQRQSYHVGVAHGSVQTIQLAQGFDVFNNYSTHYVIPGGHSFLGHDFDSMFGPDGHVWYGLLQHAAPW